MTTRTSRLIQLFTKTTGSIVAISILIVTSIRNTSTITTLTDNTLRPCVTTTNGYAFQENDNASVLEQNRITVGANKGIIPVKNTTSPICKSILTLFRNFSSSSPLSYPPTAKQVWESLQGEFVQDSITFVNQILNQHENPDISETFHDMMKLLTPDRVRKSLIHPMPLIDSENLIGIIRRRLENSTKNPPLRIAALGGSVVLGVESTSHTFKDVHKLFNAHSFKAAWANNLQRVLNNILFQGQDVVKVQNLGVSGSSSDIGSLLVEYGFLQKAEAAPPDIVIAAYGPNDSVSEAHKQMEMAQQLVKAVKTMRCDGLPVFISLLDPIIRHRIVQLSEQAHIQATLAQWHDFMGISLEKALQDITLLEIPKIRGNEGSHNDTYNSYWGNPWWNCHPGMKYHAAVSWILTYSLANSLITSCEYNDHMVAGGEIQGSSLSLNNLPVLKNQADYFELYQEWNQSQMDHDAKCKRQRNAGISTHSKTCDYKWINTKHLGVDSRDAANQIVQSVLVNNSGWEAAGAINQFQREKPGWVTSRANSFFEIAVSAVNSPIMTVTIIYLKSYGISWIDSAVLITPRVVRQSGLLEKDEANVTLQGFHNSSTSINYWETLKLQGSGALPGDKVHVTFQMVSGFAFRINGLLFCSN